MDMPEFWFRTTWTDIDGWKYIFEYTVAAESLSSAEQIANEIDIHRFHANSITIGAEFDRQLLRVVEF